ncbi:hypothetical protein NQ317_011782, partial [Molorchus minor]
MTAVIHEGDVCDTSRSLYLTYYANHVSDSLPYISDSGTLSPESCIFGQALNIIWIMLSFSAYLKYKQTKEILTKHNIQKNAINKVALLIGLLACFGLSIVGNFQETNMFYVHWLGAILCFGIGSVYICLLSVLYLTITPVIGQRKLTGVRLVLSVISVVTFMIFLFVQFCHTSTKKNK